MSIQYAAGAVVDYETGKMKIERVADILILLGDFCPVGIPEVFVNMLVPLCVGENAWKHVVYVMGIREADRLEYETVVTYLEDVESKIPNLHFLHNSSLDLEEFKLRIFGSPLFTDMVYDTKPSTSAGRKTLGEFLQIPTTTATTNEEFDVEMEYDADGLPKKGILYSETPEGEKRRVLPLSKYWWYENHNVSRAALNVAIMDAQDLPEDWLFVVATHWQPSHLLDLEQRTSKPPPVASDSLRYSVNLPLRRYVRSMDRPLVWFYAQAQHYGRAQTGIRPVDDKMVFFGTPSCFVEGSERQVIDLYMLSREESAVMDQVDEVAAQKHAASGENGRPHVYSEAENAVVPMSEEEYEARMAAAGAVTAEEAAFLDQEVASAEQEIKKEE